MFNTARVSLFPPQRLAVAAPSVPAEARQATQPPNYAHNLRINLCLQHTRRAVDFGRVGGMLPGRHIAWIRGLILALVLGGLGASVVRADDERAAEPPAAPVAPPVDRSHAEHAPRLVEAWLRAGEVDPALSPSLPVTDLVGLRVTLRINGMTVGLGDAMHPGLDAGETESPADLGELAVVAGRAALADLERTLRDAHVRARQDPSLRAVLEERDAASPPSVADVARRVLVDVQVARRLSAVTVDRHADPATVFGTFAPGFHGLRSGPGIIWPASALAANTSPRSQVVQLLAANNLRPEDIPTLARPGGPPLQRFEVIHIVRPAPAMSPMELIRGNVVLPPLALNSRTVDSLADQLAEHLRGRFTRDGVLQGTFHPTTGEYEPRVAAAQDAALACYALLRYGRYRLSIHDNDTIARDLVERATLTARQLATGTLADGESRIGAPAGAWVLLTLVDGDAAGVDERELRDALGRWLMGLRLEDGGFRDPLSSEPRRLNDAEQALVAAALAALFERTRDRWMAEAINEAIDDLWRRAAGSPNVAVLPWLTFAHNRAGGLLAGNDEERRATLSERQRTIGRLVDRLTRQQVIEPPVLGPNDVIGGFELIKGPPGSPPSPDWRTAQLLGFLAQALAEPQIVDGHNVHDWLITAGLAARFIAQLMMDEPSAFYTRAPREAHRGVRLAMFDNRLGVSATAMSLLAVTQLQEAARAIQPPAAP
jgi:hypothetical protein